MEPKEFDFEFPRGDTCPYLFEMTDQEGNAFNLSNTSEITMTARDMSKNIIFQKYSFSNILILSIALSYVSLTIFAPD